MQVSAAYLREHKCESVLRTRQIEPGTAWVVECCRWRTAMPAKVRSLLCAAFIPCGTRNSNVSDPFQTGRTPLFASDAPPDIFLFQLPNPLLQELLLWFLLGQR